MSASPDPEDALPVTPEEIDAALELLAPVENASESAADFGSLLENAPGSGPSAVGEALQLHASMVDATTSTASLVARSMQVYLDSQARGFEAVFPPPQVVAQQVQNDARQIAEVSRNIGESFGGP